MQLFYMLAAGERSDAPPVLLGQRGPMTNSKLPANRRQEHQANAAHAARTRTRRAMPWM